MTTESAEVLGSEHNVHGLTEPGHTIVDMSIPVLTVTDGTVADLAGAGDGQGGADGGATLDDADDRSVTAELDHMSKTADAMREQGLLTADEAAEQIEQVEHERRRYQDMTRDEKKAINNRLKDTGRRLLEQQVPGAPVVQETVTLNHGRLTPVLLTWWAFLNRMSVNIGRFGRDTFETKKNSDKIQAWFEDQQKSLAKYVGEQRDLAEAVCRTGAEMILESNRKPLSPAVTRPSLVIDVEAFTPYSYDLLQTIIEFDGVMNLLDWQVFNRLKDQSDMDDEVSRFSNKLRPVGVRGLNTHRKLMMTIYSRS